MLNSFAQLENLGAGFYKQEIRYSDTLGSRHIVGWCFKAEVHAVLAGLLDEEVSRNSKSNKFSKDWIFSSFLGDGRDRDRHPDGLAMSLTEEQAHSKLRLAVAAP